MLKMYHRSSSPSAPDFWEGTWEDGQLEEAVRFCDIDPLRPVFERWVQPGARLLEGGCGRGQYVAYYGARRRWILGLDFARSSLRRLKHRYPSTRLCVGDIHALPVATASFDAYFSGGVVEHFESGPELALQEAHRVLKPGGLFLVSIPYLSPFRRASLLWSRERLLTSRADVTPPKHDDKGTLTFWQYAFGKREFNRLLEANGFVVREHWPYAILHGLSDLPLFAALLSRRSQARKLPPSGVAAGFSTASSSFGLKAGLKRALVSEDRTLPLLGPAIEWAGYFCANMMLFIATRD